MDDDDNSCSWIPLSPSTTEEVSTTTNTTTNNDNNNNDDTEQTFKHAGNGTRASTSTPGTSSKKRFSPSGPSERANSLETRMNLKSKLVDHPIDLFWKRYLLNLAREIWALELHIRLGLCMVFTGAVVKVFLLSTWYFWYPRCVLVSSLLVFGAIYLDVFHFQRHVQAISDSLHNPENFLQLLQHLDSTGSRRLTLVLLLIPTALEMRTLSFLSGIKAETGWVAYNAILSCSLLGLMMYWFRMNNIKPRECLYRGLLVLYGSALWITIYNTDLSRMPVLAAPFLAATGTVLITYQDDDMEWISRVLRHSLRLTLRDVLSSMGEKVSEDEMLQLAILRWIADYWASVPTDNPESSTVRPSPAPTNSSSKSSSTTTASTSKGTAGSQTSQPELSPATKTSSTSTPPYQSQSYSAILQQRHEVSWDELLPMLNVATDHMTTEVQMLQSNSHDANNGRTSNSAATDPIESFHNMLRTLNVDERAEPAVRAYRRAVESFPPSQETAVLLSVFRRSPALLTIFWHILVLKPGLLSSTMVLLPFVVLEYHRIVGWVCCCERAKVFFESAEATLSDSKFIPNALRDADPMVIMLVGDSYDVMRPPALLLVWQNVVSSVSALEVGLTAARCAETTAVAVQFAGNVLSLVQFGQEIHRHGIIHGLIVMGKEAILYHTMDESLRHRGATKYTHAVMDAMDNAQRVARNVQTLANDEKIGHIVQPLISTACALSGYGWLWGNEIRKNGEDTHDEEPNNIDTDSVNNAMPEQPSHGTMKDPKELSTMCTEKELNRLSDLMDNIVNAYGSGQISSEQKDELCEKLSNVSESNVMALEGIQRSLDEFLEQGKGDVGSSSRSNDHCSTSTIMEMVLAAYYRGLIDQSEKAAFCRKIANLTDREQMEGGIATEMIHALTNIIANGKSVEERRMEIASKHEVAFEVTQVPTGEQTTTKSAETVGPEDNDRSDLDMINAQTSDSSSISESVGREYMAGRNEPSYSSPRRSDDVTETANEHSRENPHDALLRFGMATLSVVVGRILMSNNDDRNQQQHQNARERQETESQGGRNESTVQIEEIHDDVVEEWVSVQQ